mgnify:CR=1 FL=1
MFGDYDGTYLLGCFVYYSLVLVFRKTKKLHCIWFPAEPPVAIHGWAERSAGGKGAPVFGAVGRSAA